MKRILAIATAALAVGTLALPASAASTYTYGSVKLQWNVPLTATLNVHTNYNATGAFGGASPTLYAGGGSGCATPGTDTDLNMNFGTLSVSPSAVVSCFYKNAVAMQLTTNAKYTINQYLDTGDVAATSGTGFCAYSNGITFGNAGSATLSQSARSADPGVGTFTAGALSSCAASGQKVDILSGSTTGTGTAQPNTTYTGGFMSGGTPAASVITSATAPTGVVWAAEDLQLDLNANAPATSGVTSAYMTLQLVSN